MTALLADQHPQARRTCTAGRSHGRAPRFYCAVTEQRQQSLVLTRAGKELREEFVASFVDQYAGTQIREILFSPNSQRTSFTSKARDPIWKGYHPDGPDDQPLLSLHRRNRGAGARKWLHTAWSLAERNIDPYTLWIARARLSPWISMRMNDLHNVDDPQSYVHSTRRLSRSH